MRVVSGRTPLVISFPHVGTALPAEIAPRMSEAARDLTDTDWHVEQLYAGAETLGAAWLEPGFSRYVVDLNRPPDDAALYPGQVSTGLCPTHRFDGAPLYVGAGPDATEIAERRLRYWQPYHDALRQLIDEAKARHGYAIVLDAHSIRAEVPRLFPGRLPDINLGTYGGRSCAQALQDRVARVLAEAHEFTHVINGRFQGGYITRHYGQPASSVHALQLELAQACYMDEESHPFDARRAAPLMARLRQIVEVLASFDATA